MVARGQEWQGFMAKEQRTWRVIRSILSQLHTSIKIYWTVRFKCVHFTEYKGYLNITYFIYKKIRFHRMTTVHFIIQMGIWDFEIIETFPVGLSLGFFCLEQCRTCDKLYFPNRAAAHKLYYIWPWSFSHQKAGVCKAEGIVWEFETDRYTLLHLKWITNRDLLRAQGTQLKVMWQSGLKGSLGYVWLSCSAVYLKLSQHS